MGDQQQHSGSGTTGPAGWVATAVGGVLGRVGGGLAGMAGAIAYADSGSNEGLEGIVTMVVWMGIMSLVGGMAGAAAALRLRGYVRPVASGILFGVLFAISSAALLAAAVSLTDGWDDELGVPAVGIVCVLISSLATRAIITKTSTSASIE